MIGLTRRTLGLAAIALMASTSLSLAQQTTLTLFSGADDPVGAAYLESLAEAFEAANPDVAIDIEIGPGGTERDNMVKSRLATGTMTDIFNYNTGSLFQAINPLESTVDLTGEPWLDNILDSFKQTVTGTDGSVRGVPVGVAMGGGILYNKKVYEELGLEVPMTWDEFMANNAKIKEAGKVAVIQTFGTTWTSQIFFLGDEFNVQAANPNFPAEYTAGKAKYANDSVAMAGFTKQQEVFEGGYLNEDFAAALIEDGRRLLASGEGVHLPMLTFAIGVLGTEYPDNLNDIGFFAIPGDDPASNGTTVWMPTGLYIAANSQHPEEAKRFLEFAASTDACKLYEAAAQGVVTGPYLVKGCEVPAEVPPAVQDLAGYFESDGSTAPALEFLSPIKGPNLENITVEVGSGIRSAADGAALYDEDVKKQAQQLGLPGW